MQFTELPADTPDSSSSSSGGGSTAALAIAWQQELCDQFVFLGAIPLGLYALRTDPGTPLAWACGALRGAMGRVIAAGVPPAVQLLRALGVIQPWRR
jgi:hypothetical protein